MRETSIHALGAEYARSFRGLRSLQIAHRPSICPFGPIVEAIPQGARHLDIGCGSGFLLFAASRLRGTTSLAGVDADESVVSKARGALGVLVPDSTVNLVATREFDCWPQGDFDAVTVIDVLHHVPRKSQIEFLKAAASRVGSGGTLIYKDMARTPFWFAWANRAHDLILAREWIHYRAISEVVSTLKSCGLSLTVPTTEVTLWYKHELVIASRPWSSK